MRPLRLTKKFFVAQKKITRKFFRVKSFRKFLTVKFVVGSLEIRIARGRHHVEILKRHFLVYRATAKFQSQKEAVLDFAQLREIRLRKSVFDSHFNHSRNFSLSLYDAERKKLRLAQNFFQLAECAVECDTNVAFGHGQ